MKENGNIHVSFSFIARPLALRSVHSAIALHGASTIDAHFLNVILFLLQLSNT